MHQYGKTRYFKFLFLRVLNLIYLVENEQTRPLLLFYPREFELQSRFIRYLYIDCTWAPCKLTEDLGVARVDERIVDVVTRSHRRLAPATRHSIMLRSQSTMVFLDRPDKIIALHRAKLA